MPPIFISHKANSRTWLGQDAFEISGVKDNIDEGRAEERVTLLDIQYRMPLEVAELVSELSYGGRLKTDDALRRATRLNDTLMPGFEQAVALINTGDLGPACFIEPKTGSYSRVNPLHAALSYSLAAAASTRGYRSVGVITPYRAQARLMAALNRGLANTEDVTAATIHRFQGSERDLVIVDLVDAPMQKTASMLTGKDENVALRLLNVSLSRTRAKLIILVHLPFIEEKHPKKSPVRKMVTLIEKEKGALKLDAAYFQQHDRASGLEWFASWEQAQKKLTDDLKNDNSPVYLNLPGDFFPTRALVHTLKAASARDRGVVVFCGLPVASELEDSSIDIRLLNRAGGCFALLGSEIAYIGGFSPSGAFIRLSNPHAVESLTKFYLGQFGGMPTPDSKAEMLMSQICGRCPDCAEERRPQLGKQNLWVLGCSTRDHKSVALDAEVLNKLLMALNVRCPNCGSQGVARHKGKTIFIGCQSFGRGCQGHMPSMEDLFGGG